MCSEDIMFPIGVYELILCFFFSIRIMKALASGAENELEAMKYLQRIYLYIFIEHVRLRYVIMGTLIAERMCRTWRYMIA